MAKMVKILKNIEGTPLKVGDKAFVSATQIMQGILTADGFILPWDDEGTTWEQIVKAEDTVNKPSHYTSGGIECIDAAQAMLTPEEFKGAMKFNVLKYTWRSPLKGTEKQDLEKAQVYLGWLIEALGEGE